MMNKILPSNQLRAMHRNERKRDLHKKPVYGNATDDFLRRANKGEPKIELFVLNLDKGTDDNKLLDFFKRKNVPLIEHKCRSKPKYRSTSYRIAVKKRYVSTIMSENFWPKGIGCRYYRRRPNINVNNGNGTRQVKNT